MWHNTWTRRRPPQSWKGHITRHSRAGSASVSKSIFIHVYIQWHRVWHMVWCALDHELSLFFSILLSSRHLVTGLSWFYLSSKFDSRRWEAFFCLGESQMSNLSFLFLNVTSGLHLVVNPLYLHLGRCLVIVDFGDTPLWVRFFFTKESHCSPVIPLSGLP